MQSLYLEIAADPHAWYCDWPDRNDVFYRSGVHSPTYHWVGCFAEGEIRFYAGWPKAEGSGSPTIIFAPWNSPPNPNWIPSFQWPNDMAEDAVGAWVVSDGPAPHGEYVVDPAGGGDATTIQGGIDLAEDGDTVLLVDAVYDGDTPGNANLDFGGRTITLRSQSGDPLACVIDCAGDAASPRRAFHFHSGESGEALVEHIGIRGGYAGGTRGPDGGAILCEAGSSPALRGLVIDGCEAEGRGGAVYCDASSPVLEGCTIHAARATLGGGLASVGGSAVAVSGAIIAFGEEGEAVYCETDGEVTLDCCDLFGNAGGDWVGCIADQAGQAGNFSEDPLFCDEAAGDYRIAADSPCAEEQSGGCGTIGALPVGCAASDVPEEAAFRTVGIRLYENRPNPFKGRTAIGFVLPRRQHVLLQVFTPSGRLVQTLVRGEREAGQHVVSWSGRDETTRATAASGAYFYRLESGDESVTRRMTLLR